MEKFGIFELLDALAAFTLPSETDEHTLTSTQTQPQAGSGTSQSAPKMGEGVFASPVYPFSSFEPEKKEFSEKNGSSAVASLLARQSEISRRIDKK